MPILLGDATDCSVLLYWRFVKDLRLNRENKTARFSVDKLGKLSVECSPQELVLKSSGNTIAPNSIRPYAICVTPAFIKGEGLYYS